MDPIVFQERHGVQLLVGTAQLKQPTHLWHCSTELTIGGPAASKDWIDVDDLCYRFIIKPVGRLKALVGVGRGGNGDVESE